MNIIYRKRSIKAYDINHLNKTSSTQPNYSISKSTIISNRIHHNSKRNEIEPCLVNTRNKGFEYSCVVWRQNSSNSNQTWQTIPSTVVLQKISIIVLHLSREPPRLILLCQTLVFFFPCIIFAIYFQTRHLEIILMIFSWLKRKKNLPSRRSHSKTVSNIARIAYSCILAERRYFSEKSYRSFLSRKVTFLLLI